MDRPHLQMLQSAYNRLETCTKATAEDFIPGAVAEALLDFKNLYVKFAGTYEELADKVGATTEMYDRWLSGKDLDKATRRLPFFKRVSEGRPGTQFVPATEKLDSRQATRV